MKITTIDSYTKKPTQNMRIQVQVKGKDSGYLTLTSDMKGMVELDEKYKGQQITATTGNGQGPWITATEGATLLVSAQKQHAGSTGGSTGGTSGSTGGQGGKQGGKSTNKETWK